MAFKVKTTVLMILALLVFALRPADAALTKTPFTSVSARASYDLLTAAGSTGVMFDVRTADEYYGCGQPWNSNNGLCTKPDAYNGVPKWIVSGVPDATRLPFNIPYWYAGVTRVAPGPPEDEVLVRTLIEELLAAGAINFDTDIYILCRTAYRSYYMADWMDDQTFYNSRTGVTEYFSRLFNVDADGTPAGDFGGMQEWNASGLPRWSNYGDKTMPPQIISYSPDKDGYTTTTNEVSFIVSILEPTLPGNSAISYARVLNTCVGSVALSDLATTDLCDSTDTPPSTVVTHYNLTLMLPNGDYLWTSGVENYHPVLGSFQQASPNATYAGHDTRNLTVDVPPVCTDNNNDGLADFNNFDCTKLDNT